jgi:type I restriction enzyme R subunit
MYLDKNLREHDLMQAIARVNRTKVMKSGYVKEHGIVVDYFGVASHLKTALAIYTKSDEKELADLSAYFRGLDKEIPVLESRFRRLLQLFQDYGIKQIEQFVNQNMVDENEEWELVENCVALGAEVKFRAQFDTCIKAFFDSLDLLFNASMAKEYSVAAKRMGYLLMRMRDRYKDETLDLKWAGAKVRKLIDKYLESQGINPRIPPVMLLSDNFPKTLEAHNKSGKARASEMEHAIRWHIKVNMDKDPALYTLFKEFYRKRGNKFIPHIKQVRVRVSSIWPHNGASFIINCHLAVRNKIEHDFQCEPKQYRTLVPDYINDYLSLNQFAVWAMNVFISCCKSGKFAIVKPLKFGGGWHNSI